MYHFTFFVKYYNQDFSLILYYILRDKSLSD